MKLPYMGHALLASFFGLLVVGSFAHSARAQAPCSLYNANTPVPAGYAASYDHFSANKTLLLQTACSETQASLTVGDGGQNTYIYKEGYSHDGTRWNKITLTGTAIPNAPAFVSGTARATLPLRNGTNYVVAYVCQWVQNAWKCGCSDAQCGERKWNLQAYQKTPQGGTPSPANKDPLAPATHVTLISTHLDDEIIFFEPWLAIADKILTPVVYPTSPYMTNWIASKYMNPATWTAPQGSRDHATAKMIAHDRDYRLANITDSYLSGILDSYVRATDVIVTHSPWGEYGHEQHRQVFCVVQSLAAAHKKDVYVWNGAPDESNHADGMPVSYHRLTQGGTEIHSVSLAFNRSNYNAVRNIFISAEQTYRPADGEMWWNNRFWTWDRTWEGTYGTYNPPTTAKFYRIINQGVLAYDRTQMRQIVTNTRVIPQGGNTPICF